MKPKKGNGGFRVPESYFEDFQSRLAGRMKASGSGPIPKDAGFRVPDGYFEGLEQRVLGRPGENAVKVRRLWPGYLSWVAAAAAAILLVVLWKPGGAEQPIGFADLAGSDIEQYLENGVEDLSASDLAEALPMDDLFMGDILETMPSEDQIIDYLDSDTDNLNDLYWIGDE